MTPQSAVSALGQACAETSLASPHFTKEETEAREAEVGCGRLACWLQSAWSLRGPGSGLADLWPCWLSVLAAAGSLCSPLLPGGSVRIPGIPPHRQGLRGGKQPQELVPTPRGGQGRWTVGQGGPSRGHCSGTAFTLPAGFRLVEKGHSTALPAG